MTMPTPPATEPAQVQPLADPPADPPTPQAPPADPAGDPPADPPADPPKEPTDWKAESRKWERLAKANSKAADELKTAREAAMTAHEKALADAETKGRTAGTLASAQRLATAELRVAASSKGVDLTDLTEFIDVAKFIDADGEVDTAAITRAVNRFAKFTKPAETKPADPPPPPPRGSGEFPGGSGAGQPITEEQLASMSPDEITKALNAGRLKHLL